MNTIPSKAILINEEETKPFKASKTEGRLLEVLEKEGKERKGSHHMGRRNSSYPCLQMIRIYI